MKTVRGGQAAFADQEPETGQSRNRQLKALWERAKPIKHSDGNEDLDQR